MNDPIRTLIVDDEPLARQGIRRLLAEDPDIEVLAECGDGMEAVEVITARKPDLLFLDIQMPELDGFQVLEEIGEQDMPVVVFVTAFDQHALHAFQVRALDYLLKPFEEERFTEALVRAKEQVRQRKQGDLARHIMSLLDDTRQDRAGRRERILIRTGGRITFLRAQEIDWIEAQGDYVCLHTQGKKHLLREKISELEEQLPAEGFVRIHRSTMVNVSRVKEMQPLFHGEYAVLLVDGTRLTMSRSYREHVFHHLTGTEA